MVIAWVFRVIGNVLYPPAVCRPRYDSDGYCRWRKEGYNGHDDRYCLDCATCWCVSIACVIAAIIGGIMAVNRNGLTHENSKTILAWFGLWMGAWLFIHVGIPVLNWSEKGVPRILSWCILRLAHMLYPPLYAGPLFLEPVPEDGRCRRHERKECTPCGVNLLLDFMGTIGGFIGACLVWEKYTVFSTPGFPFLIWICTACLMPIIWRLYARAVSRVTSEGVPVRRPKSAQPARQYASHRDIPPWERGEDGRRRAERQDEPIMGLPLPPEPVPEQPKPYAALLGRIQDTPPEEATPERLAELAGLVSDFEQEHGQDVPALRDALTALEQMASVNHSV